MNKDWRKVIHERTRLKNIYNENDQEIIGTTTKNKDMCTNLTKKSMNETPFWESFKGK